MSSFRCLSNAIRLTLPSLLATLLIAQQANACTIAVVSGKVTEDGRPLLWKNRDTDSRDNLLRVFSEGRYRLMAVVDAGHPEAIWMGMNETGLCLVNSLSLDLPGGNSVGRGNGRFMKLALETCATVGEFEKLLQDSNDGGRRTRANFAVIDAEGSAVLFEAGHRSFVKFDANDPQVAPQGFVVRSNFSMTATGSKHLGKPEQFREIYSGRRYLRAETLVRDSLDLHGHLDFRFFLQTLSRDLSIDLNDLATPLPPQINTRTTINRQSTVSAAVFHGVRTGDARNWTTMWTLLGEPAFSVAVPCWLTDGSPPSILGGGEKRSELCGLARQLRDGNYEPSGQMKTRWLQEIWKITLDAESQIFRQTAERMRQWRRDKMLPSQEEIGIFENGLADSALTSLRTAQGFLQNQPTVANAKKSAKLAVATTARSSELAIATATKTTTKPPELSATMPMKPSQLP